MNPFSVQHIKHTQDITGLSTEDGAKYIAGGTNLIDLMKLQVETPSQLINLSQWEDEQSITEESDHFRIGAMVTNTTLANYAYKKPSLSLLSQALLSGATVQLRNRATTGGNLLQRTRCYYFYDTTKACNKRQPGSGCAALTSMNRIHAILGTSEDCIATHPSDMAVAMMALNARVVLNGHSDGIREIPLRNFHCEPGSTPHVENVLKDDEVISAVIIPKQCNGTQYYRKVRDRSSYAFALVSVGAGLVLKNDTIEKLTLAFGGVGTKPWYPASAIKVLVGAEFSDEVLDLAIDAELVDAKVYGSNNFKPDLLRNTFKSVLNSLYEHQRENEDYEGALYEN
ncbi:xanthine dehydrogenase family protein subunit M [Alteromonas stellipolaris]|uniref:FAD binding domain-containing protein n=1 Tax=Alteromonas stellipolaris TaxID=233316 RepID=UPI002117C782|nr:xanthine dehydrogenase family protein subunit M [Alteromonas stellipolaris]MCQ8849012.1 xanthine dehydrogenase family protein subunit M [Alteromonas stellipolaris]